ncbi:uncharacterized protein LOC141587407 isoform X2 [Silene latifolia]|uniref:uncharacterized protein LOC141587407 isoform X2 n=1 Tax=Silene latifolia TaxID=37657 RepID=UPI003D773E43
MATKPLWDAVVVTDKKMLMTLDDIIKMSRTADDKKKQRVSNKSRGSFNGNQDRSFKLRQYTDSISTRRQGALAQKRSSYQGNRYPSSAETALKAADYKFQNRPVNRRNTANWNQTRPGGPQRRQGTAFNGGNASKQRQTQHYQQPPLLRPLLRKGTINNQKPKTLDSLFADMKEQRMKAFTHPNNTGNARVGVAFNQQRLPWLRGGFGSYRN